MTIDQLIAEVAKQPTQVDAFKTFMTCLKIEMDDVFVGDSLPPSLQGKYDSVFGTASDRSNDVLHAIEDGKPVLEPVKPPPASAPGGPVSPSAPLVFVDKPETIPPSNKVPEPAKEPEKLPEPA